MALGFPSFNAHANPFSTSPDWKNTHEFRVNLSSEILEFKIPGNLSDDFSADFPKNQNIFDPDHYTQWPSFTLSSFYWDYKVRTFLWQDIYGTLGLQINIHKAPENSDAKILDKSQFPFVIESVLRNMHEVPAGRNATESGLILPDKYETVNLNDTNAIKYYVKGGANQSDYIAYATPLNESHFLEARFTIMAAHDKMEKNWFEFCLQDIDRIIRSIRIVHSK